MTADSSTKMADKMAHTEDSVLVRGMSFRPTLKITYTFYSLYSTSSADSLLVCQNTIQHDSFNENILHCVEQLLLSIDAKSSVF